MRLVHQKGVPAPLPADRIKIPAQIDRRRKNIIVIAYNNVTVCRQVQGQLIRADRIPLCRFDQNLPGIAEPFCEHFKNRGFRPVIISLCKRTLLRSALLVSAPLCRRSVRTKLFPRIKNHTAKPCPRIVKLFAGCKCLPAGACLCRQVKYAVNHPFADCFGSRVQRGNRLSDSGRRLRKQPGAGTQVIIAFTNQFFLPFP